MGPSVRGARSSIRALALSSLAAATLAHAEDGAPPEPAPEATREESDPPPEAADPTPGRRALSVGASVVPGAIVHGTGHYALGETRTGNRLLLAEGIGLGMVAIGGTTIFVTGASRYFVGPAAAVTVLGLGLFTTSFFADVYGTASPDPGAAGARVHTLPFVETELGYRRVYDPQFSYGHFAVERLSVRAGRIRVTPSGWFSTAGDTALYRVEGAYRFAGTLPREPSRDASSFDVGAAVAHQRHETDGFAIWSGEVEARGRYDLARVGDTLRGAFVEGGLGYGQQWLDYHVPGLDVPGDSEMMLLARFGFGVVLRGRAAPGSEVLAYYDHRHDGYAGGLLVSGIGSGIAGRLGATGRWYFGESLGVLVEAEAGSALIAGASLLVREGSR